MASSQLSRESIFLADNFLGRVAQVGPSTIIVPLGQPQAGVNGVPGRGKVVHEIGQYLIVDCGEVAVFGQLTEVSSARREGDAVDVAMLGHISLLTSITLADVKVMPGVMSSPQVGDSVYLASSQLISHTLKSSSGLRSGDLGPGQQPLVLAFARLPDKDRTIAPLTPEQLFGSHCAILGASGGGKSWTIARIVEECALYRSKTILLDPSGEFSTITRKTRHVYIGTDPLPEETATEVVLPYYELTETDLFAIFKPEGQSQAPKLRAAMESLKIARHCPVLAPDGTILKADRSKIEFQKAFRQYHRELEDPRADFDIVKLSRQIVNECVVPNRSPVEPQYWGGTNSFDQANCMPLVTRVEDMTKSKSLSPLFQPDDKPSLFAEIDDFLQGDSERVLRIGLQYLSTAYNAREIVANAIGRYLFQIAREGRFREQPLLVVVDEAHRFLSEKASDKSLTFPLDAFGLIAKEGRKYSINVCLATQRPQDVPQDVLSQVGTMIVHRIISDQDLRVVERASGALDRSSAMSLPRLIPGEAVIIGMAFPVPVTVIIDSPSTPPDSRGPNFQKYWR